MMAMSLKQAIESIKDKRGHIGDMLYRFDVLIAELRAAHKAIEKAEKEAVEMRLDFKGVAGILMVPKGKEREEAIKNGYGKPGSSTWLGTRWRKNKRPNLRREKG